jgi:hypothetical protein
MTTFSRRTMLTGAAAVTAAGSVNLTVPAVADDDQDLASFVTLSAALTGIDAAKLAPKVDPITIKLAYFAEAKNNSAFARMLQVFRANQSQPPETVANIILNQSGPDLCFLGRSIILAWYLGYWYEPDALQRHASPTPPAGPVPFKIISPTAYTQGWAWRVAQAHPMGYSELRFGYWSQDPPKLDVIIK